MFFKIFYYFISFHFIFFKASSPNPPVAAVQKIHRAVGRSLRDKMAPFARHHGRNLPVEYRLAFRISI